MCMLTKLWPILSVLNVVLQLPQHRPDHVYHSSFIITGPRRLGSLWKQARPPALLSVIYSVHHQWLEYIKGEYATPTRGLSEVGEHTTISLVWAGLLQ